ncbi:hypothetical protein IWX90DRAFT_412120 [Phyllosticta citrichinensis]|uniref:Uncharacterized protein n=1 Tax=Phyllosticta citrichinensis TaxID=1130410 RepID=A0ABR1Y332_9PEZI
MWNLAICQLASAAALKYPLLCPPNARSTRSCKSPVKMPPKESPKPSGDGCGSEDTKQTTTKREEEITKQPGEPFVPKTLDDVEVLKLLGEHLEEHNVNVA